MSFSARRFGIFSGSRNLPLDTCRFPTILLQTILLGSGMLKEASRNRASGVIALGLRVAPSPLRRAQRQPGTARTPLVRDSAISGVNGGCARSSPAWGRAKSSRGIRSRAVGRRHAATAQPWRKDRRFGETAACFQAGVSSSKEERAVRQAISSASQAGETGLRKSREAMPRAHTERQRRVRGVREQYGG